MKLKVLGCFGGNIPGHGMTSLLINDTVLDVLQDKLQQVPAPRYDEGELAFAREVAQTFPPHSAAASIRWLGPEGQKLVAQSEEPRGSRSTSHVLWRAA